MTISIHLVQLEQLKSLAAGSTQVDGFRVMPGSVPAVDYLWNSAERLRAGHSPVWRSFFLVIDEDRRKVVGSVNFHAEPRNGRVEIGYEIATAFRRRGYATEAVRLLVDKAFEHKEVSEVLAETEIDNAVSRRVLLKNGFKPYGKATHPYYGPVDQWIVVRPKP